MSYRVGCCRLRLTSAVNGASFIRPSTSLGLQPRRFKSLESEAARACKVSCPSRKDISHCRLLKSSRALQVELNMQGRSVFPESKYDRQESRSRVKAGQELERFSGSGRYPESVREKYRSHGRTSSVAAVAASGPRIATDKMSSRRDDLKLRYM